MSERIIRQREFQARLGVSRGTYFNWKAKGLLPPAVRLGRRALGYREADVDEFIKSLAASGGITENE